MDSDAVGGYAIVLLGQFNPPIFQPAWFALHGIITEDDATDPVDMYLDADSSFFKTGLFGCEVSRDRFRVFSVPTTERREQMSDVVVPAFKLLYHTPIAAVSMICFRHVPSDEYLWTDVGPRLVPSSPWEEIMGTGAKVDRVIVQQPTSAADYEGLRGIAIEPSRLLEGGTYVSVTHQYSLSGEDSRNAHAARDLVEAEWDACVEVSLDLISRTLAL